MKFTTKITLYNSYFDSNDRLTAKSILSIFQDVASTHGEMIGVGYEKMLEKNLLWVLSRIKFDIFKSPAPNQTVVVETWPHEKGRIDFDRDMKILSENGEVLIFATSKWCVIDSVNRSLQRTNNVNYSGTICTEVNYPDRFGKIIFPTQPLEEKFTHVVQFSDLDHNHHMNNTNYATLVFNATKNSNFKHFEINFLNECLLNDAIVIKHCETDDGAYILGLVNGTPVFSAFIK